MMTAPQLTEQQKAAFGSLNLDQFANLALVSTVEKATGKHRALVMRVEQDNDGDYLFAPVAMLLDDDDLDLFEPPSTDVVSQ